MTLARIAFLRFVVVHPHVLLIAFLTAGQQMNGGETAPSSSATSRSFDGGGASSRNLRRVSDGDQKWARSENFEVRSFDPQHPADRVTHLAEELRSSLQRRWLDQLVPAWEPRCQIVIHANEWDYLRQVGWHAAPSQGACRLGRSRGQITSRRVDLFADPDSGQLTALAHELTHAVLADRFRFGSPPRWLDEGIALQADSADKQSRHLRDLRRSLERGSCLRLGEALCCARYPQERDLDAFYGQSLSLVGYLAALEAPTKVLDLAVLADECGYDQALQKTYGIASIEELELRWQQYAARTKHEPRDVGPYELARLVPNWPGNRPAHQFLPP